MEAKGASGLGDRSLEGVLKGLDDMKDGKMSGQKLVYRI